MILSEGYEKDGEWIPEITDDPRINMELVVRSLRSADALGEEDEWLHRVHSTGDPVGLAAELADELAEAHVMGLISDELWGRLADMLDGVS
jgi:hypothetical protein